MVDAEWNRSSAFSHYATGVSRISANEQVVDNHKTVRCASLALHVFYTELILLNLVQSTLVSVEAKSSLDWRCLLGVLF